MASKPITSAQSGSFRFDVNGLRGVAVLAVLFYHYGVPYFSGGFVGVDVFFVISGFLMTYIISSGLGKSRFGIGRFYLRRIARIVPALVAMTLAIVVTGWFLFLPDQYVVVAREAFWSLTFSINHYFAAHTGYFDAKADESWFLHCWSLAVEFQYYLVFPLCLIVAKRLASKHGILIAICAAAVGSLAFCYFETKLSQSNAFYFTSSRIWEFAVGGLILFVPSLRRHRGVVALIGLGMIGVATVFYHPTLAYPGLWPLLPVLGAAGVIWANSSSIALSNIVLQFFGRISYSLYLWHWPLLLVARYFGHASSPVDIGLLAVVATLLAWLSFVFVETPFRKLFESEHVGRTLVLTSVMAATVGLSAAVVAYAGMPTRISRDVMEVISHAVYSSDYRDGTCFLRPEQSYSDFGPDCFAGSKTGDKPRLLIWGDSHAAHLYPGIVAQRWSGHFRVEQATLSACVPYGTSVSAVRPNCAPARERLLKEILARPPDIVLLSASYGGFDVAVATQLAQLVATLKGAGIDVVVLGPTPEWDLPLPQAFFREVVRTGTARPERIMLLDQKRLLQFDSLLDSAVSSAGGRYVSAYAALCRREGCLYSVPSEVGRTLIAFDQAHLTKEGSAWVARELLGPALGQQKLGAKVVEPNKLIEFRAGADGVHYLSSGWMPPEDWGVWTGAAEPGVIILPVDKRLRPESLKIKFWGQLGPGMSRERFIVRVSGGRASYLEINQSEPIMVRTIPIGEEGQDDIATQGRLRVEVYATEGRSPKALGLNTDERILGFGLRELTIIVDR